MVPINLSSLKEVEEEKEWTKGVIETHEWEKRPFFGVKNQPPMTSFIAVQHSFCNQSLQNKIEA